jgi:L-cystine transport system permease protein
MTLIVTLSTLAVSIPFGILMAFTRVHQIKFLKQCSIIYISIVRGTPTVIQIFLVYNILPRIIFQISGDKGVFKVDPTYFALIIFWILYTALFSEVFRSSMLSINKGQMEAGFSVGMTTFQVYRRILFPQILVNALPNISNMTLILIKSTSLVYLIGVKEITAYAKIGAADNLRYFEAYLGIFFIYLLLCTLVDKLFLKLETKLKKNQNLVRNTN